MADEKKPVRGSMVARKCHCGKAFQARAADVARGWGNYCSRACAKRTPDYVASVDMEQYTITRDITPEVRTELVQILRAAADLIELGARHVDGGLIYNFDDTKGTANLNGNITFQVTGGTEPNRGLH